MMATAHLVAAGRPIRLRYALGWYAGRTSPKAITKAIADRMALLKNGPRFPNAS